MDISKLIKTIRAQKQNAENFLDAARETRRLINNVRRGAEPISTAVDIKTGKIYPVFLEMRL